jgi:hypothetical protein
MTYIVSIENNQVQISDSIGNATVIRSAAEFLEYFRDETIRLGCKASDLQVYNSSTMDYPEDSTSDPAVLALAREVA